MTHGFVIPVSALRRGAYVTGELIHPIAMEEGLRFAIREGGHTVGSGIVSTIIE